MTSSPASTEPVKCARHPEVETGLRCNRCNTPICPRCAERTPVGFRCPDCILELEQRYYQQTAGKEINPFDRPLSPPRVVYILLAVNLVIFLFMELAGGSGNNGVLVQFGANYGPLILQGEIWRLFTSMFLHIGVQHLVFNSIGLIAFGIETERIYGWARFIAVYLLAGLYGNLLSFAIKGPGMFSAGASGAIFGVIGMYLVFYLYYRKRLGEFGRQRQNMVWVILVLSLVLGTTVMPADNMAHLGGFLAGAILGYPLLPRYKVQSTPPGQIRDRGALVRRWWVPVSGIILFVAGLWGVFYFWHPGPGIPWTFRRTIAFEEIATGNLAGEYDLWQFKTEAGQAVTITMHSSDLDCYLALFEPGGQLLWSDDDSGEGTDAQIRRYVLIT
jgi:membrane associated rhomboid family serine protease